MTNSEFKTELQKIVGKPTSLRPFVCDGYPLECEIFIVGINPATSINSDFWDFWKDDKFDKTKWLENYLEERKDKRSKMSLTRRKIEYLTNNVFYERKCLETNVYSSATPNLKSLSNDLRNTDIFSFLLKSIKPKAIFIHGSDPANFIRNELGIKHLSAEPTEVSYETATVVSPFVYEWSFGKAVICATRHLRLIKQEKITETATNLLKIMEKLK